MDKKIDFSFADNVPEAVLIQQKLRNRVSSIFPFDDSSVHLVAGVDTAYNGKNQALAVVVVLSFPELEPLEVVVEKSQVTFPYIPGFLSFREGPAVEKALSRLRLTPHIFFFDGQGIAHPRFLGLATHLGVLFDVVSIGVAKKPLIGKFVQPHWRRGSYSWLEYQRWVLGGALRTRDRVKPVFVSPGNRIGVVKSLEWALKVGGKYRLPEPTRLAHYYTQKFKLKT
ncbi:MAG: deoxyribonuclease [Candidatus Atribacteria bacterium]|nr:deoxyribonuclease [Candidatus Atribacteria bacterium]